MTTIWKYQPVLFIFFFCKALAITVFNVAELQACPLYFAMVQQQSAPSHPHTGRKRKDSNLDALGESEDEGSEHDSDLDLSRQIKPLGGYMRDREEMIQHMFRSISSKKLRAMLPDILKVTTPHGQNHTSAFVCCVFWLFGRKHHPIQHYFMMVLVSLM